MISPHPHIFAPQLKRSHLSRLLLGVALALSVGCEAKVGDSCVSATQCAPGQLCDISSAEGYCTVRDCEEGDCPTGSICVTFENLDRYCMATCSEQADCRDGYRCDDSLTSSPICR